VRANHACRGRVQLGPRRICIPACRSSGMMKRVQVPLLFSFPRFRAGRFCHVYGRSNHRTLYRSARLPIRPAGGVIVRSTMPVSSTLYERHFINFLSFSRMIFWLFVWSKIPSCVASYYQILLSLWINLIVIFFINICIIRDCYKIGNSKKSKTTNKEK